MRRLGGLVAVPVSCLALALFALPAAAGAAGSVYVADQNDGTISQYAIGAGGLLSPLAPATVATGAGPFAVAVTAEGKSAYVINASDNTVSQYSVDRLSGALSPKTPATVAAGPGPVAIAVTPDGKSAYVTHGGPVVSQFSVDPLTGALSPKIPASVPVGAGAGAIAVTPDGKSAYVTDDLVVSQFSIDPMTGALSPKTPGTVAAGMGSEAIAVAPNGRSAYVANVDGNTVSQYSVDPVTGALSPKTPATVATGSFPTSVAVTPDGASAYVTNQDDNTVSQYSVDPVTGALSPKTPATVAAGFLPFDLVVTADGKHVYVSDIGDIFHGVGAVSQYSVGPSSGALSLMTPATIATGGAAKGLAVGPLPAPTEDPTFASVSCSPSVFAPGDATVCKATVTDTAGSGQRTPTGTVSFTTSGAGRFYGSPCTLKGSGVSASCWVFFSSFPRGGRAITASYGGDATHGTSVGRTLVAVVLPASRSGCLMYGHGRITATNGDQASFRGLAFAKPPLGAEWYRDNGSAKPFRLTSTGVDAVTCSTDASQASVFGKARVNGTGSVEYRIDIQLAAWEHGKDTYRIRLSSGYDSGVQSIRHGDVVIHLRDRDRRHRDPNASRYRPGARLDGG